MEMKDKIDLLKIDFSKTHNEIISFIRRYVIELKKDGIVIGLSGGIDSCLILKLCVETVGKNNVLAVILPERDSNLIHMRDAIEFARSMGVNFIYKKITLLLWILGVYNLYPPAFLFRKSFQSRFVKRKREKISKRIRKDIYMANLEGYPDKELSRGLAFYRIKNRLRSSILFYYSELYNYLFVGTANKTEWLTGFFVKYGDGIADIMPIINLYKTQVFNLAKYLNINDYLIEKSPSPDLIPGIIDEDMLWISYSKLDLILFGIENNYSFERISKISSSNQSEIDRVRNMLEKSEYLRMWPIALK